MTEQVDILNIVGIDPAIFYNSGQDVNLVKREETKPYARVFRKGSRTVYRSGTDVVWDDDEVTVVNIHLS